MQAALPIIVGVVDGGNAMNNNLSNISWAREGELYIHS